MNNRLREQLEDCLKYSDKENGSPSKISIQGLKSVPLLSKEYQVLRDENLGLRLQLTHLSQEHFKKLEQLREILLTSTSRHENAEDELEKQQREVEKLQSVLNEKQKEILQFNKERLSSRERNSRLKHKVAVFEQQAKADQQLLRSVQLELQFYERLYGTPKVVLQEKFDPNNPVQSPWLELEGEAPDGSFANKNGHHVIGHFDNYCALKQQVLEGRLLVHKIESLMQTNLNVAFLEIHGSKALDSGNIEQLFSSTSSLYKMLEESAALISTFWRAALPSTQSIAQHRRQTGA